MNKLDQRALDAIRALNYDFQHFTLEDFTRHVEHIKERTIIIRPFAFRGGLHGLWARLETADYIFYDCTTHPVHQTHHILHELGHIILDHHPKPLVEALPPAVLACMRLGDEDQVQGLCRPWDPGDTPEEREVEVLVRHMQREIMFAGRLGMLTQCTSSIPELERFAKNLGYHD